MKSVDFVQHTLSDSSKRVHPWQMTERLKFGGLRQTKMVGTRFRQESLLPFPRKKICQWFEPNRNPQLIFCVRRTFWDDLVGWFDNKIFGFYFIVVRDFAATSLEWKMETLDEQWKELGLKTAFLVFFTNENDFLWCLHVSLTFIISGFGSAKKQNINLMNKTDIRKRKQAFVRRERDENPGICRENPCQLYFWFDEGNLVAKPNRHCQDTPFKTKCNRQEVARSVPAERTGLTSAH